MGDDHIIAPLAVDQRGETTRGITHPIFGSLPETENSRPSGPKA